MITSGRLNALIWLYDLKLCRRNNAFIFSLRYDTGISMEIHDWLIHMNRRQNYLRSSSASSPVHVSDVYQPVKTIDIIGTIDESKIDDTKCPVCSDKSKYILGCKHVLCYNCMCQIYGDKICPMCRQEIEKCYKIKYSDDESSDEDESSDDEDESSDDEDSSDDEIHFIDSGYSVPNRSHIDDDNSPWNSDDENCITFDDPSQSMPADNSAWDTIDATPSPAPSVTPKDPISNDALDASIAALSRLELENWDDSD